MYLIPSWSHTNPLTQRNSGTLFPATFYPRASERWKSALPNQVTESNSHLYKQIPQSPPKTLNALVELLEL